MAPVHVLRMIKATLRPAGRGKRPFFIPRAMTFEVKHVH
jgi:hypothetical protein